MTMTEKGTGASIESLACFTVVSLCTLTALRRRKRIESPTKSPCAQREQAQTDDQLLKILASTEASPAEVKNAMLRLKTRVKDPISAPPSYNIEDFLDFTHHRCFPTASSKENESVDTFSFTEGCDELDLVLSVPILDVRSPDEYKKGHIPGAHNVPLFNNEERARVGTK